MKKMNVYKKKLWRIYNRNFECKKSTKGLKKLSDELHISKSSNLSESDNEKNNI